MKLTIFICLFLAVDLCIAHSDPTTGEELEVEEIVALLYIPDAGNYNINMLYNDKKLYILANELFQYLKVNQKFTLSKDRVEGFFIDPSNVYSIDQSDRIIRVGDRTYHTASNELLATDLGLYISFEMLEKAFGIRLKFRMRDLSIHLDSDLELPIIRLLKVRQIEENIPKQQSDKPPKKSIEMCRNLLRGGVLDWNVGISRIESDSNVFFGDLNLGSEFMGGELLLSYRHNSVSLTKDIFRYRWHRVNTDNFIKQVHAGQISPQSNVQLPYQFVGFSTTNASPNFQASYGSYLISDHIEPGWSVHLYVNDVLVDYQFADASGIYAFEVPLVYGSTRLALRFYGPNGEERLEEREINIPYGFARAGKLQYDFHLGVLQHQRASYATGLRLDYGVNRKLTIGTNIEQIQTDSLTLQVPALQLTGMPLNRLIWSATWVEGGYFRSIFNYALPSRISFQGGVSKYESRQRIEFNKAGLEADGAVIVYHKLPSLRGYSRLKYRQNHFEQTRNQELDFTFSNYFGRLNVVLGSRVAWYNRKVMNHLGQLTSSWRLPKSWRLRSRVDYNVGNGQLVNASLEVSKAIRNRGFVGVNYVRNFHNQSGQLNCQLQLILGPLRSNSSLNFQKRRSTLSQTLSGSLLYCAESKKILTSPRPNYGRTGIHLTPFLDIDHDGIMDPEEPPVRELRVEVNTGQVQYNATQDQAYVLNLNPNLTYTLQFNDNHLEDISWRCKWHSIKVTTDPSQLKNVHVPILPMAEISGTVSYLDGDEIKGIGQVKVLITNISKEEPQTVITDVDGSYFAQSLSPGLYIVKLDEVQLKSVNLIATPIVKVIEIEPQKYGAYIEDVDFVIRKDRLPEKPEEQLITRQ